MTDDGVAYSYQEAMRRGVPLQEPDGTLIYPTTRSRPKPTFTLDPLDRALMAISVAVPVMLTVFVAAQIPMMDQQVPVHFSWDGTVNRYGSPWEGFWTAAGVTVMIIGIAVLAKYPRVFNNPVELNSSNVQQQYKNAVQMLTWLNLAMAIMAVGMMGLWFEPLWFPLVWVGLALMGVSMVFFIRRLFMLR
ncbi:DUF1648 domain-containing protein [Garicola koreensis]|uniref:DUF1648 domain-containing protein n=1 Tax=Garicola koreensis TaxID=1262554 RepID=A0A7W5Y032_9MICC|nr:DUF1648 domain-containing protein [Garicola koreensis]MBB3668031.1 hypothetical protein [Garicola koreensis]